MKELKMSKMFKNKSIKAVRKFLDWFYVFNF